LAEIRAIAISKFAAVAKTLRTSSGQTLDVGPKGQVNATPENTEANAEQFRDALSNKQYKANPADLGVMSDLTFKSLDNVQTWPNGKLPMFATTPSVGQLETTDTKRAFRVGEGEFQSLQNRIGASESTFRP